VKRTLLAILVFLSGVLLAAEPTVWRARYVEDARGTKTLIDIKEIPAYNIRPLRSVEEVQYPRYIAEHTGMGGGKVVELTAVKRDDLARLLRSRGVGRAAVSRGGSDEVVTLVNSGPVKNRIDLVFMGDGYTAAERQKFFDDIKRIVTELFAGDTLRSYLPVFNVHAVYRPSIESGIGKNNRPKNTAYKLYREGDTLRAIFPGDSSAAHDSCSQAPDCDYPIVVANDPFYGGLGGELAITTSSATSGAMVLRHELGHNFGRVGEEYDGQEATFFGANFSSSLSGIKWSEWLSGPAKAEPVTALFLDWPWHRLSTGPYKARFAASGSAAVTSVTFSSSGTARDSDLAVSIDGKVLPFKGPGHPDRAFHILNWNQGFPDGPHELHFVGANGGDSVLSSISVHEYAKDYHFDSRYVGAYPMFAKSGRAVGFRPTHETCLMRNMSSTRFCPVCQENNWLQFFSRIRVIDEVKAERSGSNLKVKVLTPALGQLARVRDGRSRLDVKWFHDGKEEPALEGQFAWERDAASCKGKWAVNVVFQTDEVRRDPNSRLAARWTFDL